MAEENVIEIEDYRGRDPRQGEQEGEEFPLGDYATDDELVYNDFEANLVPVFSETNEGRLALKGISSTVMRKFESAWDSSEEYRDRKSLEWRIFSGELPPKTFPWEDCANVNVPLMVENISRLVFRAEVELFGDWSNVYGVQPVTSAKDDAQVAKILSAHGNWQITEDIPDFKRQQRRALLLFFLNGDVSSHSYYDTRRRQNRHETLTTDQLITPYTYVTTMPNYGDCPFICKVMYKEQNELEDQRGLWFGVDNVLARGRPTWEDEPETLLRDAEAEIQGIAIPTDDEIGAYKILHWEGWLSLPAQVRQRYCQVIIDPTSGQILDLHVQEEPHWKDVERIKRQEIELDMYWRERNEYDDQAKAMALSEEALSAAPEFTMEERLQMQMMRPGDLNLPPTPPKWMRNPEDRTEKPEGVHFEPIHMFAHGVCIEPLTGNLGLGFGRQQADHNIAANVLTNQFIDAASLANCSGWFATNLVQFDRPLDFKPGAINYASGVNGAELKDNLIPMKVSPANPQMVEMVDRIKADAQSSIQAPSVLSGEAGKSGETFRGIATRVEQATKQLSAATRHFSDYETQVLKNNGRLNALFLPDEEILYVNDHLTQQMTQITVTREMYRRNYNVTFRSDLKFTSEAQKVQEADQLANAIMATPILQQALGLQHAVIRESLEARGKENLVPLLGPEPEAPTTAFGLPEPGTTQTGEDGLPVPTPGSPSKPGAIPRKPRPAPGVAAGGTPAVPTAPRGAPSGPGGPAPGGKPGG